MLKKIIGLGIACVVTLILTVGGTWAFLSDTGKVSQQPILAGRLNLLTGVSPDGGVTINYSSGLTQSLNVTSLKPGRSTPLTTIYLKNEAGNIDGASMGFVFEYVESDGDQNGTTNMSADDTASILQVTDLLYGSQNILTSGLVTDWNANGYVDLQDLQTATHAPNSQLNALSGINAGDNKAFIIRLQMRTSFNNQDDHHDDHHHHDGDDINSFEGDGVNISIKFTLKQ